MTSQIKTPKTPQHLLDYQKEYRKTKRGKQVNNKAARKYRKKTEWKDYFNPYFKNWLKNPINNFSHRCRTQIRYKMKNTKAWKDSKALGKNIDHIIPLRILAKYFTMQNMLNCDDKKLYALLISISNNPANLRWINKENNNRANNASIKKQLKVAEKLEENYKIICKGLSQFIEELNNELEVA